MRAFNRAFVEAWSNPAVTVEWLKKAEPLIDEKTELQNLEAILPFVVNDFTKANGFGVISKIKLEKQVDNVSAALGTKTKPRADLIFNSNFLPPKAQRMP